MSHIISLDTAIEMTTLYRAERENILKKVEQGKNLLPVCETFERSAFDVVLNQPGCVSVRIYYGMDTSKKIHTIVVGVDGQDKDILPDQNETQTVNGIIIEDGIRCPINCPPASPLNP